MTAQTRNMLRTAPRPRLDDSMRIRPKNKVRKAQPKEKIRIDTCDSKAHTYSERAARREIKRQKKLIETYQIIILALAFVLIFTLINVIKSNAYQAKLDEVRSMPTIEVVVGEGDTVWGLAAGTGINDIDMQDLVKIIMEKNPGQKAGTLEVGSTVSVPRIP